MNGHHRMSPNGDLCYLVASSGIAQGNEKMGNGGKRMGVTRPAELDCLSLGVQSPRPGGKREGEGGKAASGKLNPERTAQSRNGSVWVYEHKDFFFFHLTCLPTLETALKYK